ncbi:MAG TPA: hypothetical protein VEW08_09975 [Steroidobacteraceae bacterium]|nr:hypothetical protein [Steroidobacteraceae bacterium]
MRLGLILLLCLLNTGCALWRRDREEPVANGPREEKAEPVLKPSEALKPKSLEVASPVSDRFFVRMSAFGASPETNLRVDPTSPAVFIIPPPPAPQVPINLPPPGTELVAEEDLGLDDQIEQARMEFDIRMGERNHLRIDYFKIARFGEVIVTDPIDFGDSTFDTDDIVRTNFDWRVLSLTYTYSLFKAERFEAGAGIGVHVIEAHAEMKQPGTLNNEKFDEVAPFATIAFNASYRISKRWSITARGQTFEYSKDEITGRLSDFHGDIQFRWHKNLAVGIGYTQLRYELEREPEPSNKPALFDMSVPGPEIFFRASF